MNDRTTPDDEAARRDDPPPADPKTPDAGRGGKTGTPAKNVKVTPLDEEKNLDGGIEVNET